MIDFTKIFFSSRNVDERILQNTIFENYDTIIFDLDNTIWDCFNPTGTGIGAYTTEAPYELQEKDIIVDINGNVIRLQEGIRECLEILDNNNKNLGIVSGGQKLSDITSRISIPIQAQPSIMLLKKFDIYKYFNYDIILKAFVNKLEYVRPLGKTLFIDDMQDNLSDVQQNPKIDVLWRKSFQTWQQVLLPKRNSNFSWLILNDFITEETNANGTLRRRNKKGQLHSLYSPAIELANGNKVWYQNDEIHRENGPAIELSNGDKIWCQNDELHRTDGPAVEFANGDKEWYQNGKLHREDGPAIENVNGYKAWYQNDKRHRTDGPAIEYANGSKAWYQNNNRHRTDGPAVEYANGNKSWWLDGNFIGESDKDFTDLDFEQYKKGKHFGKIWAIFIKWFDWIVN